MTPSTTDSSSITTITTPQNAEQDEEKKSAEASFYDRQNSSHATNKNGEALRTIVSAESIPVKQQ
jgi:hypothetical protein